MGIPAIAGRLLADVPSPTPILGRFLRHADILPITGRSLSPQGAGRQRRPTRERPDKTDKRGGKKSCRPPQIRGMQEPALLAGFERPLTPFLQTYRAKYPTGTNTAGSAVRSGGKDSLRFQREKALSLRPSRLQKAAMVSPLSRCNANARDQNSRPSRRGSDE